MAEMVTRASWKTLPLPSRRERLRLSAAFSDAEWARLRQGHRPTDMDDKWFMFWEDGWLYFHRSWTGACVFGVRLEASAPGAHIVEAWASRDQDHYRSLGLEHDETLVTRLIRSHLLG